jgi:hypothetical protein
MLSATYYMFRHQNATLGEFHKTKDHNSNTYNIYYILYIECKKMHGVTKCIFLCSYNMYFFINFAPEFKYPPRQVEVKFVDVSILFQRQKLDNCLAMLSPDITTIS